MSRSTIAPPFDTTGLNPSQIAAVMSDAERLLVVASAGSGKTRTLIARIQRMIADGIHPTSIVVITFTVAASKVIQERLGDVKLGYAGTVHGFVLRLLQQHGTILGLPGKLTVVDEAEAEAMLVAAIERLAYKGTRKAVDEAVSLGVGHYRGGGTIIGQDASRVAFEYFHAMMTTGVLTFDMILQLGFELVKAIPCELLRQYQHLLVDEIQDANRTDMDIYNAMPVKTRFFVGDGNQAIYKFRGGDVGIIQREAVSSFTTVIDLPDCYRCGSAIVEAANRLISHQHHHPMLPHYQQIPMLSATGTDGKVTINAYDTAADEIFSVGAAIKFFLKTVDASEVSILVRTNELASQFRKGLSAIGIPVRQRKQVDNPLDWTTAKAFIALLTNPENDRLACKFLELKLGTEKAGQMRQAAVDEYTTINDRWLHIRSMQLADVTTAMVSAKIERESVGRVRGLIEQLQPDSTVLELQAAVQAMEADAQEESDGVTVSTAHASKGTEKQVVFICAVEEGIWPSKREIEEDHGAESRRLFYVAVTRAKTLCAISHAARREIQWKGVQQQTASRFIQEAQP